MPDWTYQTVFRPILFQLDARTSRQIAFGSLGRLAELPFGKHLIRFMGHMAPDPRLATERSGISACSPVGLSQRLDPQLLGTKGFAEFGFGFLEIGPIRKDPVSNRGPITIDHHTESITFDEPLDCITVSTARARLENWTQRATPILAWLEPTSSDELSEMVDQLREFAAEFILPIDRLELLEKFDGSLFVALSPLQWRDGPLRDRITSVATTGKLRGLIVCPMPETNDTNGVTLKLGLEYQQESIDTIRELRRTFGPSMVIIGACGIHAPVDALDNLRAGTDFVRLDSGLVFAGPGLAKRINQAILFERTQLESPQTKTLSKTQTPDRRLGGEAWFWAMLMGLSMLIGGALAMAVATTRVVLPYDEAMSGLTRDQLQSINDRLLAFMTHDRVTLSGTMLAVGLLYISLSFWGIRRGEHWSFVAVVASAFSGFLTFFSFLGFGYFDPFHAFVTAVLFQFLLLTIHSSRPSVPVLSLADLRNDRAWFWNQWGQLLFIIHGAVLVTAGSVISGVGMTSVFVREDLEFMRTTAEELCGPNPRLLSLIAHDRATFGGMLIACGIVTFLSGLWGFRRGEKWLWWTLCLAGGVAYTSAILVHWHVGYDSQKHLLPAYGGLLLLCVGLAFSFPYLAGRDSLLRADWTARREAATRRE